ncbi:MAG: diguanylate cyclase [Rhodospirillaceae bacterium]|nr:MAG: diguanylate cyclase [Rhodospirillaceae bacterium]
MTPSSRPVSSRPNGEALHSKKIIIVSQCVAGGKNDICVELAHFGYECVVVAHPNDLGAALEKEKVDALVCGLTFDGESETSLKILTELNDAHKIHIPLVVFTAIDSAQMRLGAVRAGAADYLVKPVDAADLVRVLDNVTQRTVSEPFRILVVDDDATLAMHTQLILQGAGMETSVVTDPMTIFEALDEVSPELILLDIYMPEANGKDIAAVIRQKEEYAGIPIVFLSSESDKDEQLSALKLGGDDFLTKPIRPSHLISSVSIRAARFRELRTFMARDSMTGLYNHSTTKQFLVSEISRVQRSDEEMSLVSIDIDFFKLVNDTHGHAVGDRVIKVLARLLRQRLRGADIVGRMGGEEFSVILPQTSADKARGVFEKIHDDFGNIVFHGEGETQFSVTISLGIAAYEKGHSAVSLSDAADKALYEAKHNGRNQIVMAETLT